MTKRAQATAATRARIVAATVEAHRELGIRNTSWEEIARRAEVGVGTVYRHFRSIDELLPACGESVEDTLALPQGPKLGRLFAGKRSSKGRIERLVGEVFGIYERGARSSRTFSASAPSFRRWSTGIAPSRERLTH
jgi:AcrR family transcriptional regulator